jgi:hypothetical protein
VANVRQEIVDGEQWVVTVSAAKVVQTLLMHSYIATDAFGWQLAAPEHAGGAIEVDAVA